MLSYIITVLSMELRKTFSYRFDFWTRILVAVFVQVTIAGFLWTGIFQSRGIESLNGFSLKGLIFYSLIAPMIANIVRTQDRGIIADEIYQGTLTRWLVLPVSYFLTKWLEHLAAAVLFSIQLVLLIGGFYLINGFPEEVHFSTQNILQGIVLTLIASVLHFYVSTFLELFSFWFDNTWSLLITLRISLMFFGGVAVPLALFPEWAKAILYFTPFPYMVSLPVTSLIGQSSDFNFTTGCGMLVFWILVFHGICRLLWNRGTRSYTGVGI